MLLRICAGAGRIHTHEVVLCAVPELWVPDDPVQRSVESVDGMGQHGVGDGQRKFHVMGDDVDAERL